MESSSQAGEEEGKYTRRCYTEFQENLGSSQSDTEKMSQGITEMLPIKTTIPRNWRFPGISEGENRAVRQIQTQLSTGRMLKK